MDNFGSKSNAEIFKQGAKVVKRPFSLNGTLFECFKDNPGPMGYRYICSIFWQNEKKMSKCRVYFRQLKIHITAGKIPSRILKAIHFVWDTFSAKIFWSRTGILKFCFQFFWDFQKYSNKCPKLIGQFWAENYHQAIKSCSKSLISNTLL